MIISNVFHGFWYQNASIKKAEKVFKRISKLLFLSSSFTVSMIALFLSNSFFIGLIIFLMSCTSDNNKKLFVENKEFYIKKETRDIIFFVENDEKQIGVLLFLGVKGDSVKSISVNRNGYDRWKNEGHEKIVPIDNHTLLLLLDTMLSEIQDDYTLKDFEIDVDPICLGDAAYELGEDIKAMKSYKEAFVHNSFYKSLAELLQKYNKKIKNLGVCDCYPDNSDVIELYSVISKTNKGKTYICEADIRIEVTDE